MGIEVAPHPYLVRNFEGRAPPSPIEDSLSLIQRERAICRPEQFRRLSDPRAIGAAFEIVVHFGPRHPERAELLRGPRNLQKLLRCEMNRAAHPLPPQSPTVGRVSLSSDAWVPEPHTLLDNNPPRLVPDTSKPTPTPKVLQSLMSENLGKATSNSAKRNGSARMAGEARAPGSQGRTHARGSRGTSTRTASRHTHGQPGPTPGGPARIARGHTQTG